MASILEAFLAGKEARRQADAAEQVNRMQSFLAQNGQAIFQGDTNALGQLAGMGPQGLETAMNLRNANDQRAAAEAARARQGTLDQRADQEWQWKVEEYAASKTAAEREAEAAQIEEGVKMGLAAQTPEEWDALVTQAGATDLVGMFDQREAVAQKFMTIAEILKQNTPNPAALTEGAPAGKMWKDPNNRALGVVDLPGVSQAPYTTQGKLKADLEAGRIDQAQYEAGMAALAPKGTSFSVDPATGAVTFNQGVGAGAGMDRPPTEGQLAGAGFLQRMVGAQAVFDELEGKGVLTIPVAKTLAVDTKAEGYILNPDEQRLAQAQRDWVRAKLRKESGAVIAEEEMAAEIKTYFPQPGEDDATIAQKREARLRAERQMAIGAGSAASMAGELSAPAGGSGSPETPPAPAGSTPSPQQSAPLPPDLQSIFDKYSTP